MKNQLYCVGYGDKTTGHGIVLTVKAKSKIHALRKAQKLLAKINAIIVSLDDNYVELIK